MAIGKKLLNLVVDGVTRSSPTSKLQRACFCHVTEERSVLSLRIRSDSYGRGRRKRRPEDLRPQKQEDVVTDKTFAVLLGRLLRLLLSPLWQRELPQETLSTRKAIPGNPHP